MRNASLMTKVMATLSIFVIAAIAIAATGLTKLAQTEASLEEVASVIVKRIQLAGNMQSTFRQAAITELRLLTEDNISERGAIKAEYLKIEEELDKLIKEYEALATEDGKRVLAQYASVVKEWEAVSHEALTLAEAGNTVEALRVLDTRAEPLRVKSESFATEIIALNQKLIDQINATASADYKAAQQLIILISLLSVIIGMTVAGYIVRAVSLRISEAVGRLDNNASLLSHTARTIAATSEELSQATSEQAASLEETAASVEELSSMVRKNSESAAKTAEFAETSQQSAVRGKEVVESLRRAMTDISDSNSAIMKEINESNTRISEIVKVIADIGEKTKVINEIVFQTKLLSFNASVEAARAGEHGRGFAVVAEEVGNLAQMSGNASKEISAMLESSVSKVETIVEETKKSVEHFAVTAKSRIDEGGEIAAQCGSVLDEIVTSVSHVTRMAAEIAQACIEQSKGVEEINLAMNQLDKVTQQNAATSEQTAASAGGISEQSGELKGIVQSLIVAVRGNKGLQAVQEDLTSTVKTTTHSQSKSNVVSMKARPKPQETLVAQELKAQNPEVVSSMKEAAGFGTVPSEHDPRFRDGG